MEFVRPSRGETLRVLGGVCLILIALKLPSVREAPNGSWGNFGTEPGWWCARMANQVMTMLPFIVLRPQAGSMTLALLGLTGLINPLLVLSLVPVRPWQFWCAMAILGCLAATWLAMMMFPMVPLAGHFIWVAGVLLILSREWDREPFARWRKGGEAAS